MAHEPKIDRVKFQQHLGAYFRNSPISEFLLYNGSLTWEPPKNYSVFTDISGIDTLVVKAGTNVITHKNWNRTIYNVMCASEDLTRIKKERNLNILLVSSGACGLGRKKRLRHGEQIPEKEKDSPKQKRLDAIAGQPQLFSLWRNYFSLHHNQEIGEKLVTHDDIRNIQKSAELMAQYKKWFSEGKVIVINEDDARSIEEIDIMLKGERAFRDNDGLASLTSRFLKRAGFNPMLILLSDINAIYTAESFMNQQCTPISVVKNPTGLKEQALPISSSRGRGGLVSKIEACTDAALDNIYSVIANGQFCNHDSDFQKHRRAAERKYYVFDAILNGKFLGTRFLPTNYAAR
jgi:glutamate 5-kinase